VLKIIRGQQTPYPLHFNVLRGPWNSCLVNPLTLLPPKALTRLIVKGIFFLLVSFFFFLLNNNKTEQVLLAVYHSLDYYVGDFSSLNCQLIGRKAAGRENVVTWTPSPPFPSYVR